jgi:hypothetical protein
MRNVLSRAGCVALLFAVLLAPWHPAVAADPLQVRVLPAEGHFSVGHDFQVEVWVENVSGLYGADVQLSFDPTLLAVLDANPAQPGVQVMPRADLLAPDLVVRRDADNGAGTVWYAVTQLNPRLPASGSGALFSFTARALAPGRSAVVVTEQTLNTQDGMPMPAEAFGAVYDFSPQQELRVLLPLVLVQR